MKGYILIIGILAIIISALVTLNVFFQGTLQMEMAEQFNKQQLLLANAQAANIRSYLNSSEHDLLHVAYLISLLQARERRDFLWLSDQIFQGKGTIDANIIVFDARGEIVYSKWKVQRHRPEIVALLAKARRSCSTTVDIEHDANTVYMGTAVCKQGVFDGAVMLTINIQDIAREFLAPIKSGSHGYAWMMDDKGDLLYHPTQPGMVGMNLHKTDKSCFRCHKSFEVEKRIIEGKEDNYGIYVAPSGEDKVLAYSITSVGASRWIIAVSAPYSEVTMSIQRAMRFYSWLIILIFLTTSVVSGMLIVFYRKRVKAEEIERHQRDLEIHAENLEREVAKRTEELSSEKEKLDTIVSAIGSGILLIGTNGRIQWSNQTIREMAGKDVTGLSCEDLCADCSVISTYTQNNLQTDLMSNLFGQEDRFYQITTAPIKSETGGPHGYIRLIQDVTEMKRMEEQMMHSEKMASLGRLTAGIAHEIGNPLTSVFSFVQILKDMESDEFKKESLETIYFHISRVAEILKQLSGFSKTPPVELKQWKINALLESSLSLIQYDKRAKEITIMRDFDPELPDSTTDGSQLSQVFINMILNAVDAMPNGGVLTVRSRLTDGRIAVFFEDTGIGIPKENLSRIFDPFFTTKEKGTGLGLAVSYSIIKKLNGTLTVESEANKGTRFRITLPGNGDT